jgi:5-oxopent-3-ene-1,2,5-tricarboxylate decarboxylase / 2-hydroxyhepta-2,4-diene-1,7-dioate isomerase
MKRARISHQGRAVWAEVTDGERTLRMADGAIVPAEHANWLAPVLPGATVFALGLNYADRSAQLGFKVQDEPLVFLKGSNTFVGHHGVTKRPADADQMHPECELVAVIGRVARKVKKADALGYISGYTIANDYAIRNYLENYYRPNLRVKSRDACTPLGPWIIDAADVGDPQKLAIRTTVAGKEIQTGSTAQMLFNIPTLVEYLSGFMTLMPGDMILTGTPHGVSFVAPGDEVVCEIERVGRLVNHVAAAP